MQKIHGRPIWYELSGIPDKRQHTEQFYSRLLGWTVQDSGMEGFSYRLARSGDDMVAGMMDLCSQDNGTPPCWMTYFAVDDADRCAAAAEQAGGSILRPPADIPDTGRFAILADPQGAAFGILQPVQDKGDPAGTAFDQNKPGHGHWHELMVPDPQAALSFYADLLGWRASTKVPMDGEEIYQLFAHEGQDIGGMHGMPMAPSPMWLPYFGVQDVTDAVRRIPDLGGSLVHGPQEVPGGAFIAIAQDPQGVIFAIVGPEHASQ
ncbi:VOC family protein [Paracoccus sp. Z330]|uniref:VOC family protein n=1 Tax=Paracoccus onchidii TaxID=3017813 RepID=A0ABT4ZB78_9RHOB|nr:VOC family protein [Paracoccus onchidii]MDB6176621.1 VOC family protein [Paracoccus onchidii]